MDYFEGPTPSSLEAYGISINSGNATCRSMSRTETAEEVVVESCLNFII